MIGRRTVLAGLGCLSIATVARAAEAAGVVRIDPGLDRIIAPSARVDFLASGFRWAEGPAWAARQDCLFFNDPPSNILYRWRAGDGAKPFLSPSGLQTPVPAGIREAGLNGLAIDARGALIAADSGTRAIVRIDPASASGARRILADRYEGKRFNSPNDLCIAASGAIYFTDPTYGLAEGDASPLRELDRCGLYRLAPDGTVALLDGDHRRPNGVALSPDERTLYLALSDEKQPEVLAYTLDGDGLPTGRRLFRDMRAELAQGQPGLPDGIKVDARGNLFATGPGGVHVCAPDGRLLGMVRTSKAIANCAIDAAGGRLFLTSADRLAMVALRPL